MDRRPLAPCLYRLTQAEVIPMRFFDAKFSTIVRNNMRLTVLRTRFRVGSWLQPNATLERAGDLFWGFCRDTCKSAPQISNNSLSTMA